MKTQTLLFESLPYIIRYPDGYEEGKRCPVILFLHGAGSRDTDIDGLKGNPYFAITEKHANFPFITVAPHCTRNTWFDVSETLQRLVHHILAQPYADVKRLYLMGASMGGYGTWQLAMCMPECFAAICPICGGGPGWNAARLAQVPVWAFHGQKDPVVPVEESIRMTDAVNRCGGSARLTIYPENGHDAWSDTYGSPEVFDWLLSCQKN